MLTFWRLAKSKASVGTRTDDSKRTCATENESNKQDCTLPHVQDLILCPSYSCQQGNRVRLVNYVPPFPALVVAGGKAIHKILPFEQENVNQGTQLVYSLTDTASYQHRQALDIERQAS